ncbi:MAG: VWA domain-containing protein [Halapricum sp.]
MTATPDPDDGDVFDFTGDFITRRTLEYETTDVHRLTFETDERTIHLLVPAATDITAYAFQTGTEYRIRSAHYCVPPTDELATDESCPDCDGRLRHGVSLDTQGEALQRAVVDLKLDVPFALATNRTTVTQTDRDRRDDWQPMQADTTRSLTSPAYVCQQCGQAFGERDVRGEDEPMVEQIHHADASMESAPAAAPAESLGLAAGGAKDIDNFRENIDAGFTPQPGAISTEGLFYDYYFETDGTSVETDALFAPQYAAGVSEHPLSGETQQYLAVGLDSTLSATDFKRPRLDLVAVLDVSGSMDSPFDEYYYDEHGRSRASDAASASKIEAATDALCALTEQLHEEDRLGVVLYNNRAHVAKPLRDVGKTDMHAIRQHIREISAGGGTNMEDGFAAAWDLLQDAPAGPETERRVVFMTDMMPNMGQAGTSQLHQQFADAAADGIHTTFLGIGLDENTDLADALGDVRGSNHYFIHAVDEFERRLGEEFEYMVSPLVYDLQLELDAEDGAIAAVHGAPSADEDDRLLHVTTLFPSPKADGRTRGGIVLVELDAAVDAELELVASWVERDGSTHSQRMAVDLPETVPTFDHSGVRKAVVLARYATLLKEWASDVHARAANASGVDDWIEPDTSADHERSSVPLTVPDEYARQFRTFRAYLVAEAETLGDDTLRQEVDLLETLCAEAGVEIQPTIDPSREPN